MTGEEQHTSAGSRDASHEDAPLLLPGELDRLGNFAIAAKLIVEGFYAGRRRSPFHDRSAEFADYRPYAPGDDARSLDWKAYARTDRDYVRLTRKETEMPCCILVDSSRSMAFRGCDADAGSMPSKRIDRWIRTRTNTRPTPHEAPNLPPSKLRYAAYLAAALSYLLIRQSDKVALAIGGERLQSYIAPSGTRTHLHTILSTLERMQARGATQLEASLRELFLTSRRRGLLIVISDLIEEPAALFHALGMYTNRGWQVILLQVLTQEELELRGVTAPARFRDSEGVGVCETDPAVVGSAYRTEVDAWIGSIQSHAQARRIRHVLISTDMHFTAALERALNTP